MIKVLITNIIIRPHDKGMSEGLTFCCFSFSFLPYVGSQRPRRGRPSNVYQRFSRKVKLDFSLIHLANGGYGITAV